MITSFSISTSGKVATLFDRAIENTDRIPTNPLKPQNQKESINGAIKHINF